MKIDRLKALLIAVCCFVIALCSESKCMDDFQKLKKAHYIKLRTA